MIASEALSLAKQRLREAGVDEAALEAEVLLRDVWNVPRERLYSSLNLELVPDVEARYAAVIARRCEREPLAYITGKREFYGIPFVIS
ncbi:MAG: peptide chain release factor N(5)-glutamine methyltransferase, partial [Thermomicrobiales bacterium]|nr:peptide chain release factor N(5)-glutamine methyltransferase [Thermomicrobiales bacterium]